MEEAGKQKKKNSGQALIEYLLLLFLLLGFTTTLFFNEDIGFSGIINKTMLRLGTHLEQNLKSGTGSAGQGTQSKDPYAGAGGNWNN